MFDRILRAGRYIILAIFGFGILIWGLVNFVKMSLPGTNVYSVKDVSGLRAGQHLSGTIYYISDYCCSVSEDDKEKYRIYLIPLFDQASDGTLEWTQVEPVKVLPKDYELFEKMANAFWGEDNEEMEYSYEINGRVAKLGKEPYGYLEEYVKDGQEEGWIPADLTFGNTWIIQYDRKEFIVIIVMGLVSFLLGGALTAVTLIKRR